jgi:hypothetical protein
MISEIQLNDPDTISFLNRDHIVAALVNEDEITVITTLGAKFTIPISPGASVKFADELINHVESNFVAISSDLRVKAK